MKDVIDRANEFCWQTGKYNDECDCNMCEHSFECSGSGKDDDEE